MRLSDIRGDRVFDVVADITEPLCNIATDEDAAYLFKRMELPEGMTTTEFALDKVKKALPVLMRNHKDDLVAILATLEGVPADEYRDGMSMASLVKGVYELLTDEDLLAFLS
jgi:hypothetical protein